MKRKLAMKDLTHSYQYDAVDAGWLRCRRATHLKRYPFTGAHRHPDRDPDAGANSHPPIPTTPGGDLH